MLLPESYILFQSFEIHVPIIHVPWTDVGRDRSPHNQSRDTLIASFTFIHLLPLTWGSVLTSFLYLGLLRLILPHASYRSIVCSRCGKGKRDGKRGILVKKFLKLHYRRIEKNFVMYLLKNNNTIKNHWSNSGIHSHDFC